MVSPDHKSSRSTRSDKYKRKLKDYTHLLGTDDEKITKAGPLNKAEERPLLTDILKTTTFVTASAIGGGAASTVFGKFSPLIGIAAIAAGAYYRNVYLMAGGSGLLLSPNKYAEAEQAEKREGYFSISAVGKRLEGYMNFWQEKIAPTDKKKAPKVPRALPSPPLPATTPAKPQQPDSNPQQTAFASQKPLETTPNPIVKPTEVVKQDAEQPPKQQAPLALKLDDDIEGLNF